MSDGQSNRTAPAVEGIAIVGMAGRFPRSADVEELWRNLRDGVECISFFTPEEMRAEGVSRETMALPNYVPAGGALDGIDLFDAELFGFQPREAEVTDPQHRFFLECAFEALERAGYDPATEPGAIGLFAGCGLSGYLFEVYSHPRAMAAVGSYRAVLGNDKDFLSTWVSYKLNLRGPSMSVQTACSTSLVAVHLACQSLLNGECDLALAGGVSVPARQRTGYLHQAGGIHSPDGHCRAFDAQAQGTVRGSGVAAVVLRRLSDALASGDHIHAVIRGSAVNNDGALKIGYTAPSQEGQARVISEALSLAGLSPDDISYVEAHGTGTALGDPIEIAALTQVFRAGTRRRGFCGVGSVKTNLGHLDTASGVTGLIKTALALEHRQVPPSLHFERPHPNIDLRDSPFYINALLTPWEPARPGGLRRAGVSSFGIGGTNAHVVLEEAPPQPPGSPSRPLHLFVLSARNEAALAAATTRLADNLEAHLDLPPADVAFTLQVGRKAFEHRRALIGASLGEAVAALREGSPEKVWTRHEKARFRPVAFLFPGQGAQHPGMARELYDGELTFRKLVDRCAERLLPELGLDLRHVLYPPDDDTAAGERLEGTGLAQPALFVVEYALARLWMEWGMEPQAMLGHSVGEYVAACLAGVLSLDDALRLLAARGRLMQELPAGAMLAVALPERDVQSLLGEDVAVAAVNGEARCVLSGTVEAIERLERHLVDLGIECRRLHTSHAFHSAMMDPILEPFLARVREVKLQPPRIPYVSNLSGTWITAAEATDPGYWVRHLRETVRFAAGAGELLAEPDRILLELGPGLVLSNLVKQHPAWRAEQPVVAALPHPRQRESDLKTSLKALAQIWTAGGRVDWRGFYRHERRRRVLLPTYPFQRKRYWVESEASPVQRAEVRMSPIDENRVPARSRRDDILAILCEIVRELTGAAPGAAQIHTHFLEMGIESLLMIRATQALEDKLGVRISVVQLFEELTTLDLLAGHLDRLVPPDQPLAHLLPAGTPAAAPAPPPAAAAPAMAPVLPEPALLPQATAPSAAMSPAAAPVTVVPQPAPWSAAVPAPAAGSDPVHQLLAQQLQLMAYQVDLLRQRGTPAAGFPMAEPPQPVAATPAVPAAVAAVEPARPAAPVPAAPPAPAAAPAAARPAAEAFGPFQPLEVGLGDRLTPHQQEALAAFIGEYTSRTQESKRLTQRYRPYLADTRGTVGFRMLWKEMVYPIAGSRSRGSRVWDVDGNEYIDISLGFGLHPFGHSPEFIDRAMREQLDLGIALGPQSALAGEVAELFCELTGTERAMFCNSGTEAVMGAIRAARVATRRNRIAVFSGAYHGWADTTLVRPVTRNGVRESAPLASGVSPLAVQDTLVLDYGKPEALDAIRAHGRELAAVLVEPVQSRRPEFQPREFLHELRRITEEYGIALIFDEMITGLRIHPGGAQAWFGVRADLATYGKLLAGGLPIGVVAGRAPFMDVLDGGMWSFGDGSYPQAEKIFFAGAFFKHPLTMAAMRAILLHMKEQGPRLQEELNRRTTWLADTLNAYLQENQVPVQVVHFGSLFRFRLANELKFKELFGHQLLLRGVFYSPESGNCFVCTAHTQEDLEHVIRAVKESVEAMRRGQFWPAPPGAPTGGGPGEGEKSRGERPATITVSANSGAAAGAVALAPAPRPASPKSEGMQFGMFFFGSYDPGDEDKYELVIEGARFADRNGFSAVSVPERHFHPLGGFSPNPSVVAAALARETERLQLRAGSVVVPLHHPIRIAEEWAMVDNLSGGRVGICFASGWHPDDFVFAPESYDRRRALMIEGIETVRRLWRGETLRVRSGTGRDLDVKLFPSPVQKDLQIWLTAAHTETYRKSGEIGAGVLSNLLGHSMDELRQRIKLYRQTLAEHGHDPRSGHVTMLVHSFLDETVEKARNRAREAFRGYIRSSFHLVSNQIERSGQGEALARLSDTDRELLLTTTADRYLQSCTLIGTPDSCAELVETLADMGVDEIGCFIDFGVDGGEVLESLDALRELKDRFQKKPRPAADELSPVISLASRLPAGTEARPQEITAPATEGQKGLWILAQMGPDASRAYNESFVLEMRGPFQREAMRRALDRIVARHDALRTTFSEDGSLQRIAPHTEVELPLLDLSERPAEERAAAFDAWKRQQVYDVFDLLNGPSLRLSLVRLGPDHHALAFTTHHIVTDSRSSGVILRELSSLYAAECEGREVELPPATQFREHVARRSPEEARQERERAEAFWQAQFQDGVPALELPTDRPRPAVQTFAGSREHGHLEGRLCDRLRRLASQHGATFYMTLVAGFQLLLHKLSGQESVVVGADAIDPSSVRAGAMVGYTINPLPLRSDLSGDPRFSDFLKGVKRRLLEGFAYQSYSLTGLVQKLQAEHRDHSRPALFAASINLEGGGTLSLPGLEVSIAPNLPPAARFDIGLNHIERGAEIEVACEYNTDLFDAATVRRWLAGYRALLTAIADHADRPVSDLHALAEAERHQVLVEWNDSAREGFATPTFQRLFEAQVKATPKARAAVCEGESVTYRELNARANHCAGLLAGHCAGPETRVALVADRGIDFLVAILGAFKAGAAYLPVEPRDPAPRQQQVLARSGASLVLASRELAPGLEAIVQGLPAGARPQLLVMEEACRGEGGQTNPKPRQQGNNLAYVIYTSGSTGTPKGAMIDQRGMLNHLLAKVTDLELTAADRVAQTASQCFDISVWQFLAPLVVGGSVHIVPREVVQEPVRLLPALEEAGITVFETVPSLLRFLLAEAATRAGAKPPLPALRWLLSTGEALPPDLCDEWHRLCPGVPLVNAYGPTECSDDVTHQVLRAGAERRSDRIPVGRPIVNTRLYVLGRSLETLPMGVAGELCVGGQGVGRGYLGEPARTAEVFVPDPFAAAPGSRLYRTGDLAVWRPDGSIDFRGRRDHQVKVRGFRIELGEIQSALERHPAVAEAVVVDRQDGGGDKRLVAYVVAGQDRTPEAAELRAFAQGELPDYMVPSAFVLLAALPLTANGKIDRKALPAPEPVESTAEPVAPRNPVEDLVAGIWAQGLGMERVGGQDDFFALGGHSLLATQVLVRIRQAFQVDLSLRVLFEAPTLAGFAARVEEAMKQQQGVAAPPLVPRQVAGSDSRLPLSFSQQRLWFLDQLQPGSPAYNLPSALRLQGPLDVAALHASLDEIVRRHESLRTRFEVVNGEPFQVVQEGVAFSVPLVDLAGLPQTSREREVRRLAAEEAKRPFDLSRGPFLRVTLARLAPAEHAVLFTAHHVASDAWSMGVLVREVGALYSAFAAGLSSPLAPLPVQYADFAAWQRSWLRDETLERQLAYWRQRLAKVHTPINLAVDKARPLTQTFRGASLSFSLPAELGRELKALSRQQGVTLFMTLLAGYQALLSHWSDSKDVLVGSPIAYRNHVDLEGLIGFFSNVLVLRTDLSGDPAFTELLARVREVTLGAYAHQDVPLEKLVEELRIERNLAYNPLVQVAFTLDNTPQANLGIQDLTLSPLDLAVETTPWDVTLNVIDGGRELAATLQYSTDLFEAETVARMRDDFVSILSRAAAQPELPLSALTEPLAERARQEQILRQRQRKETYIGKLKKLSRSA